jgi:hypothetical protein
VNSIDSSVPPLARMRTALAALSDRELFSLRAAAEEAMAFAPSLLAWLEHAAGWEIDRREQQDYVLRVPSESIEDDAVPHALLALEALRFTFRSGGASAGMDELWSAALELVEARVRIQ